MVIDGKSSGGCLINARVPQGSCLGSSLLMLYINSHLDVINVMVIFSKYGCFCNFFLSGFSFTSIHNSQDSRERWETTFLTPFYHFHPLHRHLDIIQAITAQSSPPHIGRSWTWTRWNLWFSSISC